MSNRRSVIIASVTMGLIGIIFAKILKSTLGKSVIGQKISRYKKIGVNSVKDFLELGELKLRLEEFSNGIKPIYDGIKIIWEGDNSKSYIIIISPEYISRAQALDNANLLELNSKENKELNSKRNWIRKVTIDSKRNKYSSDYTEKEIKTSYIVNFEKFQCRVVSANGRVSKLLTYPVRRKKELDHQEIKAWLTKTGNTNYLNITEIGGKLHDYKIVLYMTEGKGLVRNIQPFKGYIKIDLGVLPPCLCYISAIRNIGAPIEQFIGWIGEDHAFVEISEHELDQYNVAE